MKQSPEERAAAAVAELKAATRAAHEAAQELRAAMREARTQVDGYLHDQVQAAIDKYTTDMQAAVDGWSADARADAHRVIKNLNEAMNSVCQIIISGLHDPTTDQNLHADIVIDLRGAAPRMVPADSDAGRAITADAPYQMIVGPNAFNEMRDVRPPQRPS